MIRCSRISRRILAGLLLAPALLDPTLIFDVRAADWLQWRGPGREDHSPDTGLLKRWPEGGPRQLWLFENAGLGYGGYSVAGDRLFTVGLRGDEEYLIAVDTRNGTELWSTPIGPKYSNGWGDGPRMTPTVDGDRVYAVGGRGLLVCASVADGAVRWQQSLVEDLGGVLQDWGYTESPLVVGDLLVCTPGGPKGTMAGLDKRTGAVRWRTTGLTDSAQYASPIVMEHGGRPQVVQLVMKRFFGVDPRSGEVLWTSDFPGTVAVIPTPIQWNGMVYVTAGYGVGCKAVRLGADHSVETVYQNKVMKNHHGGVLRVGDHLYGYSDGPGWVCQDFKTGEEVWSSKNLGKGAVHYADGMLYCLDERSGDVALVEASPRGWNERGRFRLSPQSELRHPQGAIWPHPVVVNGRLYLRDQQYLHCYDVREH
ncbi:MAG: PQQ-like beta-propeller repeat protein [Verrucomicrobiae bacterium]|nr:PQQ-like beta-propeller repeat protein [Verrucomicrobiae bacterium]